MLVNNFSNNMSFQGIEDLKSAELRNQQHQSVTLIDSKRNNINEDEIKTSHDENNNVTRKVSSDEHTDRETTDMPYQVEEDQVEEDADKTDSLVSFRRYS